MRAHSDSKLPRLFSRLNTSSEFPRKGSAGSRVSEKSSSRKPAFPRSHRLTPSGAHPSNISHLLLGVCTHTNLEDYYELGWGKGRRGVTMPPLLAGRNHAAPTCLREAEQPGGASRRGGGKETLQEIRRRPHVGPSSRSVAGQITHGRGA